MSNVIALPGTGGQMAPEIAPCQPLYIFSLGALCREGSRLVGRELEFDDEVVASVADTLMALGFAGAETWIVSDRSVEDATRTADWLARNGLRADQLYMGYKWGADTGMDLEDRMRCRAVFENYEDRGRWAGLTVYSVTGDSVRAGLALPAGKPLLLA